MNYTEIVNKLVGNINPVGATHIDTERFKNLEDMCELVDNLLEAIDTVSYENRDMVEMSRKDAGEFAFKFLTNRNRVSRRS